MCINQIRGINQSEKIFDIPPPAPNVFFFVNSTHSFILTLCTYYTVEMYYSTVQIVDCHCLYVCQSTVHHCLLRSDVLLFIHSCPHKIIISISSAIKLFILTYCTDDTPKKNTASICFRSFWHVQTCYYGVSSDWLKQ